MIKFFKKYFVLFFLGGLVIVLILVKIFYGNTKTNNIIKTTTPTPIQPMTTTPTPIQPMTTTPTPIQPMTTTIIEHDIDNPSAEDNEITVLPYMGRKMEIAGYSKPGVLEVLIRKEEDKVEAEIEVKEWMEQNPMFKTNTFEFKIIK